MGLSFLLSLFFVQPLSMDIVKGLVPTIPKVAGGKMLVAAFVGTTMAAATFLSRPLFIKGKGWTIKNLKQQKKDSITAAVLIFVISATIMAVAAGALFYEGKEVTHGTRYGQYLRTNCREMGCYYFLFRGTKRWPILYFSLFINCAFTRCRLSVRGLRHELTSV